MSRSNPTSHSSHPCTRWFEWDGANGEVRYYDKDAKANVSVGSDFTFILLDQLATIKGWHDASDSGIHSNEVRDTKREVFIVKAFKGGTIAEGIYSTIRDRVNALGGHFTSNLYIACKGENGALRIGSLQFKGAALNAWVEFTKANRSELYKQEIRINGFDEGKKGKVVFRTPKLKLVPIAQETNAEAFKLDTQLQQYLAIYFSKTTTQRVETEYAEEEPAPNDEAAEDDIPF